MGGGTSVGTSFVTLYRALLDKGSLLYRGLAPLSLLREELAGELEGLAVLASALQAAPHDPALPEHFARHWKRTARGLLEQWQMTNYVSAVFIGTTATMLQDPRVAGSDVARTSAAVAFLCALSSLGCGALLYLHLARIKAAEHAVAWIGNLETLTARRWPNPLATLLAPATLLLWSAASFALALATSHVFPPSATGAPPAPRPCPRVAAALALAACAAQTLRVAWTVRRLAPAAAARDVAQAARAHTLAV
ncbi:hypothetical protein PsYK624_129750 [Phanerochaete sordida]|uniref:Uncharacterized protein n=1 Tax=Phanerochaete sordida TaxID=48140 RepID=A0A9P3GNT3_9APHY|nr:hypothetical protein PsYK624_129750 [Phanerochaete sordida]